MEKSTVSKRIQNWIRERRPTKYYWQMGKWEISLGSWNTYDSIHGSDLCSHSSSGNSSSSRHRCRETWHLHCVGWTDSLQHQQPSCVLCHTRRNRNITYVLALFHQIRDCYSDKAEKQIVTCYSTAYTSQDSWPESLYNIGSGIWLACTNNIAA